jgi:predicted metalloprotease with PDZ domain
VGVDDPSGPAGRAGIVSGEKIVAIGGTKVETGSACRR